MNLLNLISPYEIDMHDDSDQDHSVQVMQTS